MKFKNGEIINADFRTIKLGPVGYVISDPPYNQGYHYSSYKDKLKHYEYVELLRQAFEGRPSVIVHYPEVAINILSKFGKCEESVSWVYNSNTAKQSRLITWWNCKPDFTRGGQPYKNPTDKRIAARISAGKTARFYDWWNINQVKNVSKKDNPHSCPMPLEVMRRIILLTTDPGDLVVDPFMGSGTTAIAAVQTGRRFLGFEIDKGYYNYACRQISNLEIKEEEI